MTQPDAREGHAGRCGVAERLVVPLKPGNAGGGKGPQFNLVVRETEFCGLRLAGYFRRRMRENSRNSVRRPRCASLTRRNYGGFCLPGNRPGLSGLHGGDSNCEPFYDALVNSRYLNAEATLSARDQNGSEELRARRPIIARSITGRSAREGVVTSSAAW